MAVDIEKLIEEFVIPEMEYSPSYEKKSKGKKSKDKQSGQTVSIDEIPEVVLPKTKAEVYEEAKGRLNQKTSAVSRRAKSSSASAESAATKAPSDHLKTVTIPAYPKTKPPKKSKASEKPKSDAGAVAPVSDPVWVGSENELVPFAWRMPLIPDIARPSKYYKQAVREAKELLLPVIQNK